jgi:hypothetical protein
VLVTGHYTSGQTVCKALASQRQYNMRLSVEHIDKQNYIAEDPNPSNGAPHPETTKDGTQLYYNDWAKDNRWFSVMAGY